MKIILYAQNWRLSTEIDGLERSEADAWNRIKATHTYKSTVILDETKKLNLNASIFEIYWDSIRRKSHLNSLYELVNSTLQRGIHIESKCLIYRVQD